MADTLSTPSTPPSRPVTSPPNVKRARKMVVDEQLAARIVQINTAFNVPPFRGLVPPPETHEERQRRAAELDALFEAAEREADTGGNMGDDVTEMRVADAEASLRDTNWSSAERARVAREIVEFERDDETEQMVEQVLKAIQYEHSLRAERVKRVRNADGWFVPV